MFYKLRDRKPATSACDARARCFALAARRLRARRDRRRRTTRRSPAHALADQFVTAWTRGDYAQHVRATSTPPRSGATSTGEFAERLPAGADDGDRDAARRSPARRARPRRRGRRCRCASHTRLFGTLSLDFTLQTVRRSAARARASRGRARWRSPGCAPASCSAATPTCRAARRCSRATAACSPKARRTPARAQAKRTRSSPLGERRRARSSARVGPVPAARRQALEAQGVPADASVGAQRPRAGARRPPARHARRRAAGRDARARRRRRRAPAPPVRTSVSPAVQRAAVDARSAASSAGSSRCSPRPGRSSPSPGIGLDGLQPPGSTFKMVTAHRACSRRSIANPHTVFPYATLRDARRRQAEQRQRRGMRRHAGTRLRRLLQLGVHAARRQARRAAPGRDRRTLRLQPRRRASPAQPRARCPPPREIQGELDVGSTAIGQGQVLATPLQMATVAATIADGGRRPTADASCPAAPQRRRARAMSASVARTVRRLMIGVVREGTGTAAAIPGVTVAGKTGTAELKTACTARRRRASSTEAELGTDAQGRLSGRRKRSAATPTPGSPRSRRRCTRASSSACCSSKTAPAATPRRRSRARCSKPALQASR